MTDSTVLRLGQVNTAGDDRALFLKLFSGEVLNAFDEACKTADFQYIRTIASGKSASFPATWKVTAAYHTPGAELTGQTSPVNERIINIDNLLVADVFLDKLDEAMAHFELRGEYARQSGLALANAWDKNSLQVGILAARASATVSGGFGGSTLTSATTLYRTSASDLAAGIYAAVQTMDEKDIPEDEVKRVYVRPAQYYLLAQSTDLLNRDWADGAGNYGEGKIIKVAGCPIVKTNHLPNTDLSASQTADMKNTYGADFSLTAALVCTAKAVGTVKLLDLATEIAPDPRRRGVLLISEYAIGTGILRPEGSVELKTTS